MGERSSFVRENKGFASEHKSIEMQFFLPSIIYTFLSPCTIATTQPENTNHLAYL